MPSKDEWITVSTSTDKMWDREDPLEGELIKAREGVGPNNSWLYTIRTEKDGDVGVWGSTVLDSRLHELSVGDQVRITPLGKTKSPKTGREYMDFEVAYKPGQSGYDKAKQIADQFKDDTPTEPDNVAEVNPDEEINLDNIPF